MPLLCNSDGCVVWISSDWRPRLLHGIASQFSRNRGIFRLGIKVADLSWGDDADTPSTSTSTSTSTIMGELFVETTEGELCFVFREGEVPSEPQTWIAMDAFCFGFKPRKDTEHTDGELCFFWEGEVPPEPHIRFCGLAGAAPSHGSRPTPHGSRFTPHGPRSHGPQQLRVQRRVTDHPLPGLR